MVQYYRTDAIADTREPKRSAPARTGELEMFPLLFAYLLNIFNEHVFFY